MQLLYFNTRPNIRIMIDEGGSYLFFSLTRLAKMWERRSPLCCELLSIMGLFLIHAAGFFYTAADALNPAITSPQYTIDDKVKNTRWIVLNNDSTSDDVDVYWQNTSNQSTDSVIRITAIRRGVTGDGLQWVQDVPSTYSCWWSLLPLSFTYFSFRHLVFTSIGWERVTYDLSFRDNIIFASTFFATPPRFTPFVALVVSVGNFLFVGCCGYLAVSFLFGNLVSLTTTMCSSSGVITYIGGYIIDSYINRYYSEDEKAFKKGVFLPDQYHSMTPFYFRTLLWLAAIGVPMMIIICFNELVVSPIDTFVRIVLMGLSFRGSAFVQKAENLNRGSFYMFEEHRGNREVYYTSDNPFPQTTWKDSWLVLSVLYGAAYFVLISPHTNLIPLLNIAKWDLVSVDVAFCSSLLLNLIAAASLAACLTFCQCLRRISKFNFDWWFGSLLSCSLSSLFVNVFVVYSNSVGVVSKEVVLMVVAFFFFISMVSFSCSALLCGETIRPIPSCDCEGFCNCDEC
eukprot:TRINITY_DN690_c0_g1_i2.p1 TRINITY_DN690_c0_g1~~TRINITY_DN690_c0_g1_i2.p1  ORF type:complete len:512 (+),score=77.88 TRINITY_DN690_c0_g1_i2:100-1635(+)